MIKEDKEDKDSENNITFFLEEDTSSTTSTTSTTDMQLQMLVKDIEKDENIELNNLVEFFDSNFYYEKLTCKELMLICEYYGIAKQMKNNKCKKEEIIFHIVSFESNPLHTDIVFQRKNMWFYMNELKNDKCMKKYVLW